MSNSVKRDDIWHDFAPLDQLNTNPFAKNRFFLAKEFSLMTKTADLTLIMTSFLQYLKMTSLLYDTSNPFVSKKKTNFCKWICVQLVKGRKMMPNITFFDRI